MRRPLTPEMVTEIDQRAVQVQRLAEQADAIELDRLRDETAALQALIAEAQRLERQAGA